MEGGAETIGEAVRTIYAESGVGGFYRGLGLKLCQRLSQGQERRVRLLRG